MQDFNQGASCSRSLAHEKWLFPCPAQGAPASRVHGKYHCPTPESPDERAGPKAWPGLAAPSARRAWKKPLFRHRINTNYGISLKLIEIKKFCFDRHICLFFQNAVVSKTQKVVFSTSDRKMVFSFRREFCFFLFVSNNFV